MADYLKRIQTTSPAFVGRENVILAVGEGPDPSATVDRVEVPDGMVLCNGCNTNLYPEPAWGLFLNDELYDVYCDGCTDRYFEDVERRD